MKPARIIPISLAMTILIAIGFTIYFYMNALQFTVAIEGDDQVDEYKYHFTLIVQEYDNPYFAKLWDGAQAAAEKYNVSIEYKGPRQTNFDEHMKMIEKSIASRVDGIITQGLSEEFIPVINKAIEKGIPVITVDTDLNNSMRNAYVGTNNYQAGYEVGLKVAEENQKEIRVGVVAGDLNTNQHGKRVKGFLDAVEDQAHIHVVGIESSNLSNIQATEKAFQMLKNDPNINVFFGTSAMDGLGITSAIDIHKSAKSIKVYTFDDIDENIRLLQEGKIHAVIQQEPYTMGYQSVVLMNQLKNGHHIHSAHYTDTHILKKENILHKR